MTPQFPRIFLWHLVRNLRRHRALSLLNVFSVALGIAVFLAVQIANHSANQSFSASIDLVAGKSHLEIRGDVPETLWPVVTKAAGVRSVTGVVEGVVTLPDFDDYLRVLGLDLFTGEPFRTFKIAGTGDSLPLESWLGQPGGIAVSADFARGRGLKVGDKIRALANSQLTTLTIRALLERGDSPAEIEPRLAVMDIGWAQELFAKQGSLSALQLLLDNPRAASVVAGNLRALLPPDLAAEPPRQRSFQIQNMLSAFQLNLTALSMVSLLVGVFLIYNTVSASVARRRVDIGILRALGTTRLEVRLLFLGEACLLGAIGISLGMGGGVALARVLTGAVASTISSLYVLLSIDREWLSPAQFFSAAAFGFGAVIAGAWFPASEAARVDPVAALRGMGLVESGSPLPARRAAPGLIHWPWKRQPTSLRLASLGEMSAADAAQWASLGVTFLALAIAACVIALRFGPPVWSFIGAFFVLAGFAFFAPCVTKFFASIAASAFRFRFLTRLAADNLGRSLHRNAVTVAALSVAIAMVTGLTVMIFSFRSNVDAWITRGIVADLFIAPASNESVGLRTFIPPAAIDWLRARPEVRTVDTYRETTASVSVENRPSQPALLAVVGGSYQKNMTFLGGDDERKMARVFSSANVAISEPFARKFNAHDGDHLTITTPRGPATFQVAGTYSDYTRDQGAVFVARKNFDLFWDDPQVQSLAVYLRADATVANLADSFRAEWSRGGEFAIMQNRDLRTRILKIFDQTFAVTYVLRTVAIIVAIAGIFLSVTTFAVERSREIGVLRAIGASQKQVQALLTMESAMIGLVAAALGLGAGSALALTLTRVVNPAFFGWTIALQFPWPALLFTPVWMVAAAVLAATFPAWRASKIAVAQAVREE